MRLQGKNSHRVDLYSCEYAFMYVTSLCHNDPMKLALFSFYRRENRLREVKSLAHLVAEL